jgi:hypothetical protein
VVGEELEGVGVGGVFGLDEDSAAGGAREEGPLLVTSWLEARAEGCGADAGVGGGCRGVGLSNCRCCLL